MNKMTGLKNVHDQFGFDISNPHEKYKWLLKRLREAVEEIEEHICPECGYASIFEILEKHIPELKDNNV